MSEVGRVRMSEVGSVFIVLALVVFVAHRLQLLVLFLDPSSSFRLSLLVLLLDYHC